MVIYTKNTTVAIIILYLPLLLLRGFQTLPLEKIFISQNAYIFRYLFSILTKKRCMPNLQRTVKAKLFYLGVGVYTGIYCSYKETIHVYIISCSKTHQLL